MNIFKLGRRILIFILIISTTGFLSCHSNENQVEATDFSDWSNDTHSKNVDPDYSVVFNQDEVLRFDIEIDSENWITMQKDLYENLGSNVGRSTGDRPQRGKPVREKTASNGVPLDKMSEMSDFDPVWVSCSFNFNNTEWYNVGIRYKGNSSLRSAYQNGIGKLSFKLDFDEFEDDYPELKNQRFYGFKQLNLNNNYDDQSLMREKVASDLFREFGLVSAQTTFCEVYIDYGSGSQYMGLYTLVEEIDDTVLETQLGDDSGNIYKPDGMSASFADGTFNDIEMVKKNNEDEADYSDVQALYNVINSSLRITNPDQWRAELGTIFNVDGFIKWLAANTIMQNWDTYGKMTHNYYLYNNHDTNLLNWIPWDNNESLQNGKRGGALSLDFADIDENWPLIRYLFDDSVYNQIYEEYLGQFINEVLNTDIMIEKYNDYFEMIKEYAYKEEPGFTFIVSDSKFDFAVEELKLHVQSRNMEVLSYLK